VCVTSSTALAPGLESDSDRVSNNTLVPPPLVPPCQSDWALLQPDWALLQPDWARLQPDWALTPGGLQLAGWAGKPCAGVEGGMPYCAVFHAAV